VPAPLVASILNGTHSEAYVGPDLRRDDELFVGFSKLPKSLAMNGHVKCLALIGDLMLFIVSLNQ
jgi:hypothetical protein